MKYYSYNEQTKELLVHTLRDFDYLDYVTPSYPIHSIISDAELPNLNKNETLVVVGDRSSFTYMKNDIEITMQNVMLVSKNLKVVEDHRGEEVYSTLDGSKVEIKEIGALPEHITTEPRPSIWHTYVDGAWIVTAESEQARLDTEKQQRISELNAEMNQLKIDLVVGQAMGDDISGIVQRINEIRAELENLTKE